MSNIMPSSDRSCVKTNQNGSAHCSQTPKVKPTFRYTLNNNKLSLDQRQFYEDNGYLIIPRFFGVQGLDKYVKRFHDFCEGRVPKGSAALMKEISYLKDKRNCPEAVYKLQDINWDEVFGEYITDPKLLDYVECFTGPNITVRQTMLINKSPDYGTQSSRHPPHQDLIYFPFRPEDRIVAAMTALEKMNIDNGCLYVFPGSHKEPLHPHIYPNWQGGVNKGFLGIPGFENRQKTFVELEKGDVLFFHPLLIHGSGLNLTKGSRKCIISHFSTTDSYYIEVTGTVQESPTNEIVNLTSRYRPVRNIKELWECRARQVRPSPKAHL